MNGYFVRDRLCFNGATSHHNCTSRAYPGFEFFVVTDVDDVYAQKLFSGVVGLSVDPQSDNVGLIEYLKEYKFVDEMLVAIALDS